MKEIHDWRKRTRGQLPPEKLAQILRQTTIEKDAAETYERLTGETIPEDDTRSRKEELMADCMTFPDTVEEFMEQYKVVDTKQVYSNGTEFVPIFRMKQWFEHLKSTQQTLYGYDIEHLKLIANVLQKENLPPESIADALMDIGRIVAIVRYEFEKTLREAVEQCRI